MWTFFLKSRYARIIFVKDVPVYFLILLKYFGIIKAINTGCTGPDLATNRVKI